MIAKHYGKTVSTEVLRNASETTRQGASLDGLSNAAQDMGLDTFGAKISVQMLLKEDPTPCIAFWNQNHWVVIEKLVRQRKSVRVQVADPAEGKVDYSLSEFKKGWLGSASVSDDDRNGIVLLLQPGKEFDTSSLGGDSSDANAWKFVSRYFKRYKKFALQVMVTLLATSFIQLTIPFITQSIVDVGIQNQDINFIYLVLMAQLFLFVGKIVLEVVRSWLLLHLTTRINISLISDFFIKLMRLPIAYFDTRLTGDLMQRINDHKRIEQILSVDTLNTLFSFFNLVVFAVILGIYSLKILTVFLIGSTAYMLWVRIFMKRRRKLDYQLFAELSKEQSIVMEIINSMQEIKLQGAENRKRWNWESIRASLFKVNVKNLTLYQLQSVGSGFLSELTNIIITVLSAFLVLSGDFTLGMMLATSYIIGQLTGPVQELVRFIHSVQDAKIAVERISEIHDQENEDKTEDGVLSEQEPIDISFKNVSFTYKGISHPVLKSINLEIPKGKMTAIVGASGSGKTTIMKMILKYYSPQSGNISINAKDVQYLQAQSIREATGVVMQEGFIFNDTIARNVAVSGENVDVEKVLQALEVANIRTFVQGMPLGLLTTIGSEGTGLSMGQKQRILIARAVYRNPRLVLFDEATSALDANNEAIIMNNLERFYSDSPDRTVVVIAHRLSTVKKADQILVLDDGVVAEQGTHSQLLQARGMYYTLLQNQLQLDLLETEDKPL
jgi:ATP-binding cassette subfamily B protein